jgi:CBS domain-containing protein
MLTVGELLASKASQEVCTIGPDASVYEAIRTFAERNLGALIVLDGSRVVGVVTERDYARKIILLGRSSQTTTVREIMSTDVIYVTPDTAINDCMAIMTNRYIRHLPVVDQSLLVGIISIGDVVKSVVSEHTIVIDHLVAYITDSPQLLQEQRREVLTSQHGYMT